MHALRAQQFHRSQHGIAPGLPPALQPGRAEAAAHVDPGGGNERPETSRLLAGAVDVGTRRAAPAHDHGGAGELARVVHLLSGVVDEPDPLVWRRDDAPAEADAGHPAMMPVARAWGLRISAARVLPRE